MICFRIMAPKKCSSRSHVDRHSEDGAPVTVPVHNIKSSKKLKRGAIDFLIKNGDLEAYHTFLCQDCYDKALNATQNPTMTFSDFCVRIENDDLTKTEFQQVSTSFAKLLKTKMKINKNDISLNALKSFNVDKALTSINEDVRLFLEQLVGDKATKPLCILNTHENLQQLVNTNYIGTLNFAKTVLSYCISGSRRIVEINAAYSPSGSYCTVMDFLKHKAAEEYHIHGNEDCIYFFDNNQIMARSWKVQFNHKPLVSVVTTVVCLTPPTITNL